MKKFFTGFFFVILILLAFPQNTGAQVYTKDKVIAVDLGSQMLHAWEGGNIVYSTPISSGLPASPTVKGTFQIYSKFPSYRMVGVSPVNGHYDHPGVPSVMYFYKSYAIHGAYWHNNFGTPMSNGCVNLSLGAASWVYNFAPVGTAVIIY